MEVRATVAPAVEVDAPDLPEREDRPLDPGRYPAEVRLQFFGQVGEGVDMDVARECAVSAMDRAVTGGSRVAPGARSAAERGCVDLMEKPGLSR